MSRLNTLNQILKTKIVAIVRLESQASSHKTIEALAAGGVTTLEITVGTPGVFETIKRLREEHPLLTIGAGSVLDTETAKMAIAAGAQYIVTPVTKTSVINICHRYDVPILAGAFSPTEILQCFEKGADIIKVFPADILGIPFIKAIKAPMPQLRLMPTGGVTVENATEWLGAGADALGVGGALVNQKLIAAGNFEQITANAKAMVAKVAPYQK